MASLPTGDELIYKVRKRDKGGQVLAKATMTLTLKSGYKRTRTLLIAHKKFNDLNDERKHLIIFLSPWNIRGVSFLDWREDDSDFMFLYLSARKEKDLIEIRNSRQHRSFMDTDLSYAEMHALNESKYLNTTVGTAFINGSLCWLVESFPKNRSVYSKVITWIEISSNTAIKTEYYKHHALSKTLNIIGLEKIDDIWTVTEIEMLNHEKESSTRIKVDYISYNIELPDSLFNKENLINFEQNLQYSYGLLINALESSK